MKSADDVTLVAFTPAERKALRALRRRLRAEVHGFSDREHAHLLFLSWLYHTGRIESAPAEDSLPMVQPEAAA